MTTMIIMIMIIMIMKIMMIINGKHKAKSHSINKYIKVDKRKMGGGKSFRKTGNDLNTKKKVSET